MWIGTEKEETREYRRLVADGIAIKINYDKRTVNIKFIN